MKEAELNGNLNLINKYILTDNTTNDSMFDDETDMDFNDEIMNTDFNNYFKKELKNEDVINLSSNSILEDKENQNTIKNHYTLKKSDIKILKKVSYNDLDIRTQLFDYNCWTFLDFIWIIIKINKYFTTTYCK